MENIKVVKIKNPEKYKINDKKYGILIDILPSIAVIEIDDLLICVKHNDYYILHPGEWCKREGKIIVYGESSTGIRI